MFSFLVDSNAESFNDLINHQISQGGNMMLISEEYFRSKVSTSSLTPQALYEKRIQAADSEKLLWMSLKVALKHQGQVSYCILSRIIQLNKRFE